MSRPLHFAVADANDQLQRLIEERTTNKRVAHGLQLNLQSLQGPAHLRADGGVKLRIGKRAGETIPSAAGNKLAGPNRPIDATSGRCTILATFDESPSL